MKEKIELKYLASYLPYGIQVEITLSGQVSPHRMLMDSETLYDLQLSIKDYGEEYMIVKPLLLPLSDLTKEIEHDGKKFVPIDEIERLFTVEITAEGNGTFVMASILLGTLELPYCFVDKFCEWHFNVFELPEKLYIRKV